MTQASGRSWLRHPWVLLVLTWVGFNAVAHGVSAACRAWFAGSAVAPQAGLKLVLIAAALGAAYAVGLRPPELGFRRPENARWGTTIFAGLGLGAATSLA